MKSTVLSRTRRLPAPLTALLLGAAMAGTAIAGNILGYVPSWAGNPTYIQYNKLTHINYAFAEVTTNGGLNCDTRYLSSIVSKAHAAGVKVLISIGGASNGRNMTAGMRNARTTLTTNIENFVATWGLDGADIDWEAPSNASDGGLFNSMVQTLYTDLHPKGKLVTAALDTGDWFGMHIPSSSFEYLDLLNIMGYDSGGDRYFSEGLTYWTGRGVPKDKLMAGVGFFGRAGSSRGETAYKSIVAANPDAPYKETTNSYRINGIPSMQAKTQVAKSRAGGIMIWELSQDTTGGTSLLSAIYDTMVFTNYAPIGKVVSLLAKANSQYVSTPINGDGTLIANGADASLTEQFKVVGMGGHNIALLSQANGKYVTAVSATNALAASKSEAGNQETFTWQINADCTVSLLSIVNTNYVSADLKKGTPPKLWANRTAASNGEKFAVQMPGQSGLAP